MPRTEFRFAWRRRIRYAEVDAQGVVYFARHLALADEGVVEYWRAAGIYADQPVAGGAVEFHVVHAGIDYLAPLRLDEEIDILIGTRSVGRSSLDMAVELHGADREDPRARLRLVQVYVDRPGGSAAPVPPWILGLLERFEGRTLAKERQDPCAISTR